MSRMGCEQEGVNSHFCRHVIRGIVFTQILYSSPQPPRHAPAACVLHLPPRSYPQGLKHFRDLVQVAGNHLVQVAGFKGGSDLIRFACYKDQGTSCVGSGGQGCLENERPVGRLVWGGT